MGAMVGCCGCGERHGRNQEYQGLAPAIEPMQQDSDSWITGSQCATELLGLGSAKAPPEESLPSIDKLGLSVTLSARSTRSQSRTSSPARGNSPVFGDINPGSFSISPRTIPFPRFNTASSQVGPSPARSPFLPPLVFPHVECDVGADLRLWRTASPLLGEFALSPRSDVECDVGADLRLWRTASPLLGEFALSPRSVQTENCGDEEASRADTETSHEALGASWPWPDTVAVEP
eukprot:CAMPEP_0172940494 /NCGR_PEP_ID=MMETSP1075-20121228/224063_1 /TAXON_ID=2916 /ORGANISM="Ceratium fusus, Strain PA161109" /LENGTH=233 /DNA_ID=CAMNT_0013801893 /DNA_START=20 /DNA_END=721 /DNA_ORIENTATION=-